MHLKYILETQPWRREEIHSYLDYAEPIVRLGNSGGGVAGGSPNFGQSLGALFAYKLGDQDKGIDMTMAAFARQLREYMHRLEVAGLPERRERIHPQLKATLEMAEMA